MQERNGGWRGLPELGGRIGHRSCLWSHVEQQGKGRRILMDGVLEILVNFLILFPYISNFDDVD